jgi:protoheme ferro-lyase
LTAHQEKVKELTTSTKSENSKLSVFGTNEVILEPPSFIKGTVEKIVEIILRNRKEFEEKLIAQERMTRRFHFLCPTIHIILTISKFSKKPKR